MPKKSTTRDQLEAKLARAISATDAARDAIAQLRRHVGDPAFLASLRASPKMVLDNLDRRLGDIYRDLPASKPPEAEHPRPPPPPPENRSDATNDPTFPLLKSAAAP